MEFSLKVSKYLQARSIDVYLVFVGLVSTAYGYRQAAHSHGWAIGEWLINYRGGFVRRGFLGEVILRVAATTHIPLPWLVLSVQVASYVLFLWSVHRLVSGLRLTWAGAAMLLSPATLSFIVLDPPSGFKKEILLFAFLGSLLCFLLFGGDRWRDWQVSGLLTVALPLLVLTHEALILFLPYFLPPLWILRGGWRRTLRIAALPGLATVLGAGAAILHPGTAATAEAVCRSVGGTAIGSGGPGDMGICNGGIAWLSRTLPEAHAITMQTAHRYDHWQLYGFRVVPALAPMAWMLYLLWRDGSARPALKVIWASASVSFGASAFLFYSATDWGRWIHIHAVCLMLLALLMGRLAGAQPTQSPSHQPARSLLAGLALAGYALCWTLPAVGMYPARTGYFGLYDYLRGYSSTHSGPERRGP